MMSYINETDFVIENKQLVYPEIVTDGLQLYYDAKGKRDTDYHRDTMLDMSGNKNHGTLHNFAYEKHSGYKDGLVFDYIDDKLVRPALNLQPNDFTFMLNGNIISFSPDGTVKRVQDGEVIESKGFNLVRNGDFIDGRSRWSGENGSLHVINNSAKITSNGVYSAQRIVQYGIPIPINHKFYFYFYLNDISQKYARKTIQLYAPNSNSITSPDDTVIKGSDSFLGQNNTSTDTFRATIAYMSSEISSNDYFEVNNIGIIDLTKSFGAGKEPTKEQMDEIIDRFGFIPNAQDLIDRIEYKGNDLGDMENIIDGLYKADVLSGEEIYTDKADDDAVVHVEVDGKSCQHAGSGKNMFNKYLLSDRSKFQLTTYSSSPAIQLRPNTTYTLSASRVNPSPDGNQLVLNIMDATGGVPVYGSPEYNTTRIKAVFNMYGEHSGFDDFRAVFITPESGLIFFSYYDNNLGKSSEGNWFTDVMIDAQLEEGSITTEYEPPVQSPDYPIKIHSLNDFDVVSSVGYNNQFLNTDFKNGLKHWRLISSDGGYEGNEGWSIADGRYGGLEQTLPDIESLKGHVLYGRVELKSDSSASYFVFFNDGFTQVTRGPSRDTLGKFTALSALSTINDKSQRVYCRIQDARTEGWTETRIRNLYVLDLTEMYGKGNEPTQKEMDMLLKDKWAPSIFDITESDNHPFIDKINLLLDEPLRSVGDVKDRLFRDGDGVWKVERNVHYEMLSSSTPSWFAYPSYDTDNAISTRLIRSQHTHSMSWADIRSSHFTEVVNAWTRDGAAIGYSAANGTSLWIQIPKSVASSIEEAKQWTDIQQSKGTPVQVMYPLRENKYIEILSQSLQDKLNNLRSFSESNYVYTVDGNTNLLDTVPLLNNHWYPSSGAQQTPVSNIGQTATQEPLSVYPGAKIHLTKETAGDNYWRVVWVDKNNNVIRRETSTANDLVLTAPNRTYGMRVSYPNGSNAVIGFDKSDISKTLSENLKPTLHAKFLYNNWYKEDRVINNLMIYNRALTNEEMLQNYKTIKRRWGM